MAFAGSISAIRLGSGNPGKHLPFLSLGMRSPTVPARPPRENSPPDCFLTLVDPIPIEISVPPSQPGRALLAIGRASCSADHRLHQPFRKKADHLAPQIGIRASSGN